MEAAFKTLASYVALGCEAGAVVILGVAAVEAALRVLLSVRQIGDPGVKRRVWVGFASWIVLSLEFALAADIVDTAISPNWDAIGQLAAIATIRTMLNYFLTRDIEYASRGELARPAGAAGTAA